MTLHPRQNWRGRRGWPWGTRAMGRREFLRLSGGAALGAAMLACARREEPGGGAGGSQILIGSPQNPVTQPIFDDNPPVDSGLEPEPGPLRVYNWEDYVWRRVLKDFEAEYGVTVELSTFYNLEEGIEKLRTGEVAFDIFFPTAENIPKLVAGKLLQPLNLEYAPNLEANIWPQLANPFYDQGSRYTVPYVVYQTGIGWREDIVDVDPNSMSNPWDLFWDPAHRDVAGLYDDYRETMGVGLYHVGNNDINTGDPAAIEEAKNALIEASSALNLAFTIDGAYIRLPEGRLGLQHAWSGDLAAAPYYAPKGEDPTTLRWMWPPKGAASTAGGYVSNDAMGIPRNAEHPVLAHHFLNFMLDRDVSLKNFSWVLYQPPLQGLEPISLVEDGYIAEYLESTVVQEEDFQMGQAPLQLTPEADARWLNAWSEVQAGG
ncbi:MAG: polyamine ABC transporter substrate-binding protein [Actinomycetota bacterium]